MIQYFGCVNGKHQLFETEEGALLDFQGPDANKFVQIHAPKLKKTIGFKFTEKEFLDFLDSAPDGHEFPLRVGAAAGWEVGQCDQGHTVMTLLDDANEPFAEAHIGGANDVNQLILALIASCRKHTLERLRQLIEMVKGSESFEDAERLGLAAV